ncbi:MAG TPA: hypothetical protein DD434_00070 [Bacteroidales bacterium]|nr:hypothetical protein [Bacteroidales bacterium]
MNSFNRVQKVAFELVREDSRFLLTESPHAERIDDVQKPFHCVLRLVEKGVISDMEPYKEFIGHDDLFDFVCFPNDFNYTK